MFSGRGRDLAALDPLHRRRSASHASARHADLRRPRSAMKPFMNSISVRRPFAMSCAIDGRCRSLRWRLGPRPAASPRPPPAPPRRPRRPGQRSPAAMLADLARARSRAPGRPAPPRRRAGCRTGGSRRGGRGRCRPGRWRRHAVAHAVDAQLGPALAPQVGGDLHAVDAGDHLAQLLDPRGDAAMHLADAEHRCGWRRPWHGAADLARLVQLDRDGAAIMPTVRPQPTTPGDPLLVDAVLQRDDDSRPAPGTGAISMVAQSVS